MASEVLSGGKNPSYTNNTGQNVRVVINYMRQSNDPETQGQISISWAGVNVRSFATAIGRNLAFFVISSSPRFAVAFQQSDITAVAANNALGNADDDFAFPTELMLAPGQKFSAICGVYNIVVIPEAG